MTRPSRWQRQCVTNFSFMEQLHRRHHNSKAFSCYVIGQEVLPCLECIQILLDRDCKIYGFISLDNELRQWSVKQNIPFLGINYDRSSDRYLIEFLSQHSFDYLFSIENYYLLNEDVLKLPRKGAVNYHNSLLPRYAGCEVEHWAIANREKTHGITWHFMSKQVDAGDIIKQVFFEVSPIETAFSLNEKSDRAAVKSFSQLIDELATNRVSRVKQNLEERTYYAFSKRPPVGCVFSWNLCADEIDTFIRSLTYSCNRNYVGTPKIAIDNKFLIVPKIRILNFKSGVPAGTIVKIELKSIQIATQTNDVILTEILTIEGNKLPLTKAVSQFSCHRPDRSCFTRLAHCGGIAPKTRKNQSISICLQADRTPADELASYVKAELSVFGQIEIRQSKFKMCQLFFFKNLKCRSIIEFNFDCCSGRVYTKL